MKNNDATRGEVARAVLLSVLRWVSAVLDVALVSTLLSACGPQTVATDSTPGGQEGEALEFDVFTVAAGKVSRDIEGFGNLVAHEKATVVSRIDGIVEKVLVKKGDRVSVGDRLLEVSNYQLELERMKAEKETLAAREELESAKMQCIEGERDLYKKFILIEKMEIEIAILEKEISHLEEQIGRKRLLFEKGGLREEELRNLEFSRDVKALELAVMRKEHELESHGFRDQDLVEEGIEVPGDREEKRRLLVSLNTRLLRERVEFAELRSKKALIELDSIDWLLEKRVVRAPITGVVTELLKFAGEKVDADEAVTTVLGQEQLIARVTFPERDLPAVRQGDEVSVFVGSLDRSVRGKVRSIDPFVDAGTRSFCADCLLANAAGFVPGMFVRVTVPVKRVEKVLLVPKKALIAESEGRGYVYIVSKNDRIFRREVIYEGCGDVSVVITDGVREGDRVLHNPLVNLLDGVKIRCRESEGP